MIRFWPRKPRFPVIIDIGRELLGAKTGAECSKKLSKVDWLEEDDPSPVIDSSAEGFAFYSRLMVITPLTVKKRWTKAEIVALYNTKRSAALPEYPGRSLNNKPIHRLVCEIAELLSSSIWEGG